MISTPSSHSFTLQQQQCNNNNNNAGSSSDLRLSTYKIHHHSPTSSRSNPAHIEVSAPTSPVQIYRFVRFAIRDGHGLDPTPQRYLPHDSRRGRVLERESEKKSEALKESRERPRTIFYLKLTVALSSPLFSGFANDEQHVASICGNFKPNIDSAFSKGDIYSMPPPRHRHLTATSPTGLVDLSATRCHAGPRRPHGRSFFLAAMLLAIMRMSCLRPDMRRLAAFRLR
ncbi:hypothetical protein Syun_000544 [Stephania yunnanensis]|uniref:Uncharacterized protein n=1 Tax=Stephania yunnanensis TaxID=152371 RepID=A0AAP0LG66_9MAGN